MKPILPRKKEVQIRIGPAPRKISEEDFEKLIAEIMEDEEE